MSPAGVVLAPPVEPMLARASGAQIPTGDYLYEPKWDGFRCLIFRTADGVVLQSRGLDDLAYAFPEVVQAAAGLPVGAVLDGELVALRAGKVDFTTLSARIRPRSEASGNIARLAAESPVFFIGFDALARPGVDLREEPAVVRRDVLTDLLPAMPGARLTPATTDVATAEAWFTTVLGAGLDGIIAKPTQGTYQPGVRALVKVKPEYTADVVIAGWRPHKTTADDGSVLVGSLVLALYGDDGRLHHVGSASSFTVAMREELTVLLAGYALAQGDAHPWADPARSGRLPDAPSRWRRGPGTTVRVRPELVAEVRYDGIIDGRFRHVARWLRWREDRTPQSCRFDQLVAPDPATVDEVLHLRP